jgi:hypothetical protein
MDVFDMDTSSWGDEEVATRVGGKNKAASRRRPAQQAKKTKAANKTEAANKTKQPAKKKGKTHAEVKPSRVRPYAYLGMAQERANFQEDWTGAVQATWNEALPGVPMPASLNIQDPQHIEWIVLMVAYLCPLKGLPMEGDNAFSPEKLRKVFTSSEGRKLFTNDSFVSLHLTTTTGKHLSVGSGLLSLLARALDVDHYTVITNDENVLMWYNKIGPK